MEAHQEISAAFRSPQSAINSTVYFRSRHFICFVPAFLLLSGRSFNQFVGPPAPRCLSVPMSARLPSVEIIGRS